MPEDATWEVTEERLEQKRRSALRALRDSGGIDRHPLARPRNQEHPRAGRRGVSRADPRTRFIQRQARPSRQGGENARSPMRWFIQGLLGETDNADADALTAVIRSSNFAKRNPDWLPCLLARLPLGPGASLADGLSGRELKLYWEQFDSGRHVIPPERKDWLIAGLCSVVRPRAALWALRGNFEGARTESLRLLIDTLPQSERAELGLLREGVDLGHPEATRSESRPTLRAWSSCSSTCSKPTKCRRWPRPWRATLHGSRRR